MCKEFILSNTGCPDLSAPEGGSVTVNGVRTGYTAVYSCNPEFKVVGDVLRRCMSNSEWSGQPPTCQIIPGNKLVLCDKVVTFL